MPDSAENRIIPTLRERFGEQLVGIYLYGSQASGDATSNSDWDIALLPTSKMNAVTLWKVGQELARFLDRDVDLVDLLQTSTVMQYEIIRNGKRLFAQDESACNAFESQVWSMYLRFNEERSEILKEIQQRKQVL
jgi:uncharacterized protein